MSLINKMHRKITYSHSFTAPSRLKKLRCEFSAWYNHWFGDMDVNMYPYVQTINETKHFYTLYCCEGHPEKKDYSEYGYICFESFLPQYIIDERLRDLKGRLKEDCRIDIEISDRNTVSFHAKDMYVVMHLLTRMLLELDREYRYVRRVRDFIE
jgi:hypothetical protein